MSGYLTYKRRIYWDFCGDPVVKTEFPMKGVAGSIPGQGIMIPHALRQLRQPEEPTLLEDLTQPKMK